MSVKFAFSRPTQTSEERDALFGSYRSVGYDGLQLKHVQYAPYIAEPERFIQEWGGLPGIGSALITGGTLDEASRKSMQSLFKFAEKIGTELIVFCHGVSRKHVSHEDIRIYAGMLSELGKSARQHGVSLSLHHHFDQPVMYRDDFDIFFDNVKDDAVRLTIDTAHLVKSGIIDVAEVITSFAPVIDNFHMKDFANGEWRVLGEGDIDFGPIFNAVGAVRYKGWISADEESGSDIVPGMRQCLSFLGSGLQARLEHEGGR